MWNTQSSVNFINEKAESKSLGKCAAYVRRAIEAGGVTIRIPAPRFGSSASACDYGPSLEAVGFKPIFVYSGIGPIDTGTVVGQVAGDVVVIQPIQGHPHGHIALFNGVNWVSDFIQLRGFYPGQQYRNIKPAFKLYRFERKNEQLQNVEENNNKLIKICFPVSQKSGSEFRSIEDITSHLDNESTGKYMIGRNGMWHGGIHITNATTPWCALTGKAASEKIDFPIPYKGEQFVRCMADGEIVAYRMCHDYLGIPWQGMSLSFSGSFVLVRHYIQLGETKKSGLKFYTLYMHLAPYSAYQSSGKKNLWKSTDRLSLYRPEWVLTASTNNQQYSQSFRDGTLPKGSLVEWDSLDSNLHTMAYKNREYGLVTIKSVAGDASKESKLKLVGCQYWMLVDNNNIVPSDTEVPRPVWWRKLSAPSKQMMKFDEVITLNEPLSIKAGDPIGHLGYFQAAKAGGYDSRYQVHIECISTDGNLESFLTNPEKVGIDSPHYLKYYKGVELFNLNDSDGTFTSNGRVTTSTAISSLIKFKSKVDKVTKKKFWFDNSTGGYIYEDSKGVKLLSQYDLSELGFKTYVENPSSFDHLDGKNQPKGFVRGVFESLFEMSKNDNRKNHELVSHNYNRLLIKIDSGNGRYSPQEYLNAIHNPFYKDVIEKTIVKHPSDWYHKKDDTIWQSFITPLKKNAPDWAKYSENFLDKMSWMQDLTDVKLGPSLWHMHPVMFLHALQQREKLIWGRRVEELFGRDVANEFKSKVIEVGKDLSIDPNYIMACMALETGEKFNTSTKNPNSTATGLIQFMSATAKDLGTTTTRLAAMTHVEQMDYVKNILKLRLVILITPLINGLLVMCIYQFSHLQLCCLKIRMWFTRKVKVHIK
jgi:hypothetical protein